MNAPARQEARQLHSLPILSEFKAWLDGEQEKLLPKSPAGQAAQYARNQWEALTRYCEEGDLAIDNNAAERMMKPCAIGRKNLMTESQGSARKSMRESRRFFERQFPDSESNLQLASTFDQTLIRGLVTP